MLSFDEKSQIQALDRTQPSLPMKPGRADTMTHDYKRNGTTTLFAALNIASGQLIGKCFSRHRHEEFLVFLRLIDREVEKGKQIHIVLDKPDDDRFWAASLEMGMAVTIHVQLDRNGPRSGPLLEYPNADPEIARRAAGADVVKETAHYAREAGVNAMQLAMSGVFDRFPALNVFFAEAMIGWLPLYIEAADERYDNLLPWVGGIYGWEPVEHHPSYYIRNNCYWSFMRDRFGVQLREVMGVEHIMWASDFPHYETDFPGSLSVIDRNFEGVPLPEVEAMTSGNITKLFQLQ